LKKPDDGLGPKPRLRGGRPPLRAAGRLADNDGPLHCLATLAEPASSCYSANSAMGRHCSTSSLLDFGPAPSTPPHLPLSVPLMGLDLSCSGKALAKMRLGGGPLLQKYLTVAGKTG